jgi:hypothetical protein
MTRQRPGPRRLAFIGGADVGVAVAGDARLVERGGQRRCGLGYQMTLGSSEPVLVAAAVRSTHPALRLAPLASSSADAVRVAEPLFRRRLVDTADLQPLADR